MLRFSGVFAGLLSSGFLGCLAFSEASAQAAADPFRAWLEFRPRWEAADQDGVRPAEALTVRTRLGFETRAWKDLSATLEFEDVRSLYGNYNDAVPPAEPYAVIADPEVTEVNLAQLVWKPAEAFSATLGRQRINLDDQRFVGGAAWRQDEQTFDALRLDYAAGPVQASYAYVDRVNRIFGDDLDWDSNTHMANLRVSPGPSLELTGFAYLMDFEDGGAPVSNATYGARMTGVIAQSGRKLAYAASLARQTDYGGNPVSYEARYAAAELTLSDGPVAGRLGWERLGAGDGGAFQTPLATGHAFNGFADVFLTTPRDGLDDIYVGASYTSALALGPILKPAVSLTWHDFSAERTGADLGTELDLTTTFALSGDLSGVVKLARYNGAGGLSDRTRFWLGFTWKAWQ
ncbi:putative lipoprotein [Hyphomonas neptunium ATCC 15444]|uniref:Putative lipoprotein n=2 Tax=Hyphomonas TaxID=85 RepID=Q0C016_HYPNA|nr:MULTISPECIES: alginate export family protein [Hyphomonas]ABI78509.1 putative lipoprotein [Hyphomonas neptunium ATCC 15444]KCZ86616.1 putative lipoprotein [Hyphomonas hirschiana VP5]